MRTNSKIRFGVMALAAALLLFLIWLLFLRARPTEEIAGAPGGINSGGVGTTPTAAPQNTAWEAVGPIPDRTIVTPGMFRPVSLPNGASTENYVTDPESIRGFITSRSLPARAKLLRADLLGHITQIGVAGAVRPGFRAQVIPIANKATLHDLIHIGDYVDVIASFDQEESRAVVQNVRVLAVDTYGKDFPQVRIAARGPNRAEAPGVPGAPTPTPTPAPQGGAAPPAPEASVTLEVTPQQAASLSLSQAALAPLDLILRPRPVVTEVVLGGSGAGNSVSGNSVSAAPVPVVVTKTRLAPYATLIRRGRATTGTNNTRPVSAPRPSNNNSGSSGSRTFSPQPQPDFAPQVPPLPIPNNTTTVSSVPSQPQTYKIPIYGDGKIMREDEVLKP